MRLTLDERAKTRRPSAAHLALALFAAAVAAALASYVLGVRDSGPLAKAAPPQPLNKWILAVADTYTTGGEYKFLPPKEKKASRGVTRDLYYQGVRVAQGEPDRRCYCSGIVLETYMRACEEYAREHFGGTKYALHTVVAPEFTVFLKAFYGAGGGTRRTHVDALISRGLGEEIVDLDKAEPGDLVQIWSNNGTGHAAVFKGWERDDRGVRAAIRYWSVQAFQGIGEKQQKIGEYENDVDPNRIWIVRPYAPLLAGSPDWIPPVQKTKAKSPQPWYIVFSPKKMRISLAVFAAGLAVIAGLARLRRP